MSMHYAWVSATKMSEDFDGKLRIGEGDGRDGLSGDDDTRRYQDGMERRGGATHSSWGGRGKVLTHADILLVVETF